MSVLSDGEFEELHGIGIIPGFPCVNNNVAGQGLGLLLIWMNYAMDSTTFLPGSRARSHEFVGCENF